MSRYRDQLREGRKWALVEAGYSEDLTPELKQIALEKADELFDEFKQELIDIESEEEEDYCSQDIKFRRSTGDRKDRSKANKVVRKSHRNIA